MCFRTSHRRTGISAGRARGGASRPDSMWPRQQYVPAIRWHDGQSEAVMMRWGLIPSWADGSRRQPPLTVDLDGNTRLADPSRTLAQQPTLHSADGRILFMATDQPEISPTVLRSPARTTARYSAWPRIWDRSVTDEDDVIESCSIICVPPNELMMAVANTDGRMHAICAAKTIKPGSKERRLRRRQALRPYKQGRYAGLSDQPAHYSTAPDDPGLISPAG